MRIEAVHILASGPSLTAYCPPPVGSRTFVIAVNSAVEFCRCDAWCCMDAPAFAMLTPVGAGAGVDLLHIGQADARLQLLKRFPEQHERWERARFAAIERAAWPHPPKSIPDAQTYSATAAVSYAVELARLLGIYTVELYGADMAGDADWRGVACAGRGDDRWPKERRCLDWCRAEAQRRMVNVRRHLPEGVAA